MKCATVPLPDGATLVTFQDITDSVNVERALRERNEALEDADKIKIDFVHHVSYELRSPLTNIIGFAHFLGDDTTGPLNQKQHEYLSYITTSTNALLAIINNILDLATIDAGAMTLNLGEVDIRATMDAAAEGVQDRLEQAGISLSIRTAPDIGAFVADERRVRQALFNLLANAISFSPPNGVVTLAAQRLQDSVVFMVTDQGPGIPADVKDKVFDWFETHSLGSRHRGTGLGLSLVRSFVELHGGTVSIDSSVGRGTTVTCIFPTEAASQHVSAALAHRNACRCTALVAGHPHILSVASQRGWGGGPLHVVHGIARVEPLRPCEIFQRPLGLADIGVDEAARHPGTRRIRIERQRTFDQRQAIVEFSGDLQQAVTGHPERLGVVLADLRREARVLKALLHVRVGRHCPAEHRLKVIAPRRQAVGAAIRWINFDRLLQQPQRLLVALVAHPETLQRAQIAIIRGHALGRLALDALDLGRVQRRCDRGRHLRRDAILHLEHVVEVAVEAVGPDMIAA